MLHGRPAPPDSVRTLLNVLYEEDVALSGTESAELKLLRDAWRKHQGQGDEREGARAQDDFHRALLARLHQQERSALCLAGPGVRGAIFGLGVLQGLAACSREGNPDRPSLIGEFDFLSTVSGGSYIGAWLSVWATRAEYAGKEDTPVDGYGVAFRALGAVVRRDSAAEAEPIRKLRRSSNFLRTASEDRSLNAWKILAEVIRNVAGHWIVALPLFAALISLPIFLWRSILLRPVVIDGNTLWYLLAMAAVLGTVSTGAIAGYLSRSQSVRSSVPTLWLFGILPFTLFGAYLSLFWAYLPSRGLRDAPFWDLVTRGKADLGWLHAAVLGAMISGVGALVTTIWHRSAPDAVGRSVWKISFAAALAGAGAMLVWFQLTRWVPVNGRGVVHQREYITFVVPAAMAVLLVWAAVFRMVAQAGDQTTESADARATETYGSALFAGFLYWLVSFAALNSMSEFNWYDVRVSVGLIALTCIAGYAAARLSVWSGPAASSGLAAVKWEMKASLPAFLGLGASGDVGQLLSSEFARSVIASVLARVFLLLAIVDLSALTIRLTAWVGVLPDVIPSVWPAPLRALGGLNSHLLWVVLFYLLVAVLFSKLLRINSLSALNIYRGRLQRTFLGPAGPSLPGDDHLPLARLSQHKPLQIFNLALHLTEQTVPNVYPFTATRLHVGSFRCGYRATGDLSYDAIAADTEDICDVGTALAISGVTSSMSDRDSATSLVREIFGVRFGWWIRNPRKPRLAFRHGGHVIRSILDGGFKLNDLNNDFVYVTSGSHYDQLGLFEAVQRRCGLIIVADANCDPSYHCDALASAIRTIRVELGISIELSNSTAKPGVSDSWVSHCTYARILYGAADPGAPSGVLVYVKPSLNGDEPWEVRQYAARNASFPHQGGGEQFIDDGQFEAYRQLGIHIVQELCGHTGDAFPESNLRELRARAEEKLQS